MRQQRKNYETPTRAWQGDRIQEEKRLLEEYGLTSKEEVWKAQSTVRKFRRQARKLNAADDPSQEEDLLNKLTDLGILEDDATINDILDTDIEDILERRLQTIIYRRGLADTPKEARQFITHGHIMIDDRRVTVPSYLVSRDEEDAIRISPGSKQLVSDSGGQEA
jgi:small subunit ribosomal protein S4